jgi:hypothetical protein
LQSVASEHEVAERHSSPGFFPTHSGSGSGAAHAAAGIAIAAAIKSILIDVTFLMIKTSLVMLDWSIRVLDTGTRTVASVVQASRGTTTIRFGSPLYFAPVVFRI